MPDEVDIENRQLAQALKSLDFISEKSARASARVGIITLMHLAVVSFFVIAASGAVIFDVPGDTGRAIIYSMLLLDVVALFGTILLVWNFDRLTREGNLIYQEISDEVERDNAPRLNTLQVRFTLRRFVLNATLPFYRKNENGPGVYILANVLLSIVIWAILTLHR